MQVTPGQVAGSPAAFPPTQQHGAYQQPGFAVSASGHQQQPPSLMTSPPPRRDYSRQMITLNSIQIANTVLNVSFGIAEIFLRSVIAVIGVSIWVPLCVSFCFISMRNRLGRVDALFFQQLSSARYQVVMLMFEQVPNVSNRSQCLSFLPPWFNIKLRAFFSFFFYFFLTLF